jgi:hypothetical protein
MTTTTSLQAIEARYEADSSEPGDIRALLDMLSEPPCEICGARESCLPGCLAMLRGGPPPDSESRRYLAEQMSMWLCESGQGEVGAVDPFLTDARVRRHAALVRLAERTPTGNALDSEGDRVIQNRLLKAYQVKLAGDLTYEREYDREIARLRRERRRDT